MRKIISLTIGKSVLDDIDSYVSLYKKENPDVHINRSEMINSLLKYSVEDRSKLVLERVYRSYKRSKERVEYLNGFYGFYSL